ncbi:MAG: peptidylprolyl isomerase [Bacteroidetes bacterium]|nr:peptidylprolyl isomerase [Bacteroidota bacterium]MDA0874740.1 peptidylprolyl isomerase [Bacteroidota bacterium]
MTKWGLAGLILVLTACGSDPGPGPDRDARVLAEVDDFAITVSWFEQTYIDFLVRSGANDSESVRFAHLEQLIDAVLLASAFEDERRDTSSAFVEWTRRIEMEELGSRFFEVAFLDTMSAPTEAQLRQAYLREQSKRVVRHLFFTSMAEAQASWGRLESGEPFLEEARRVYDLPTLDSLAGYLGPVGYFSVDDAFAEAAWALENGTYSEPVRTRYGYHIIQVDDVFQQALIAESAYQTRRPGLSSQFRQRRRRLEGDRFVRAFMTERDVQVNAPAIEALNSLITALDPTDEEVAGQVASGADTAWKADVDPDTPLLTWMWDGQREAFTADQYAFWFESLPQREARERTAASVGRALRNEALARAGMEEGLQDDEWQIEVDRRMLLEKAQRMRQVLRQTPVEVDSTLIREAFQRLGWDRRRVARVSFRAVTANRPEDLMARRDDFGAWPVVYEDVALEEVPEWSAYVATAPVDSTILVGRRDDWAAIRVQARTRIVPTWQENSEDIVRRLQPFVGEYRRVAELRRGADIRIDRDLMKEIAEL